MPAPTNPAKVRLDSTPPIIFDVTVDYIKESDPESGNPCVNEMYLRVVAEDDQTPPEELRYRVEDTSGKDPYFLFDEPVPYFFIPPPFGPGLRLRIYVLDEAGNQSEPFAFSPEDGEDEGCSLSHGGAAPATPTLAGGLAIVLAWLARRRGHAMKAIGARARRPPAAGASHQ